MKEKEKEKKKDVPMTVISIIRPRMTEVAMMRMTSLSWPSPSKAVLALLAFAPKKEPLKRKLAPSESRLSPRPTAGPEPGPKAGPRAPLVPLLQLALSLPPATGLQTQQPHPFTPLANVVFIPLRLV